MSPLLKSVSRIALPVIIGLVVTFWLFNGEVNTGTFTAVNWNARMLWGVVIACIFVVGRDFGLAWRFHTIAHPQLNWPRAWRVDIMCAFTSAITPSAVGGSALAIFYLNREGVKLGKATTLTLITLLFDELFFVIFCPVIFLIFPSTSLFAPTGGMFTMGIQLVFWLVYAGICGYSLLLYLGIIWRPEFVARLIRRIGTMRIFKRWQKGAFEMADNMIATSKSVHGHSARWWANVFGATVLSWFSRYLVVAALFWGFVPNVELGVVFARQFVVWVLLMVSPTPGGAGVSEWLFTEYYGDFIGSATLALVMALTWRIITYYCYLFAGSLMLPAYFRANSLNTSTKQI